MANRRMFSKTITNSSRFLMMPVSTQTLYFHLNLNADDDGFCEHFTIMRMIEAKPDDLKILQARGFVKVFDEFVLVICEWKEHNYIRADRYTPSKYLAIYKEELRALSSGTPNVIPVVAVCRTQVRLGKVRLGKNIPKNKSSDKETIKKTEEILEYWNKIRGGSLSSTSAYKDNLMYWLKEGYALKDIKKAIDNVGDGIGWAKPPTLTLLLRQQDKNGKVDRIGDCLGAKKKNVGENILT